MESGVSRRAVLSSDSNIAPTSVNDLEHLFISYMLGDESFLFTYIQILKITDFHDPISRRMFVVLEEYWNRFRKSPSVDTFLVCYGNKYGREQRLPNEYAVLDFVCATSLDPSVDKEFIRSNFIYIVQERRKIALAEEMRHKNGNYAEYIKQLHNIASIAHAHTGQTGFLEGLKDWSTQNRFVHNANRIRTGFPRVDAQMDGGPEPGEYILILGYKNSGKSWLMINIAANAIEMNNKNVIYFTNENSVLKVRTRFAMRFLEMSDREILRRSEEEYGGDMETFVRQRLVEKWGENLNEKLHIVPIFGQDSCIEKIMAVIENLRHRGFDTDLIVVDDLDHLKGYNSDGASRKSEEQLLVDSSDGLLAIANNMNVVVWAAGQLKHIVEGKINVSLGKSVSRSHRAKVEIPCACYFNLQTSDMRNKDDRGRVRSVLVNKYARNFEIDETFIPLIHQYGIGKIWEEQRNTEYFQDEDDEDVADMIFA